MDFKEYIDMMDARTLEEGKIGRLVGAGLVAGLAAAPWVASRTGQVENRPARSAERESGPKIPERPDDPILARFYDSDTKKIAEIQASIDHYKSKAELTEQEEDRLRALEKEKAKFESVLITTQKHLRWSMDLLKRLRSDEESFSPEERTKLLRRIPPFMLTDREIYEAGVIP
jgi:hypothetical protein